MSISVVDPVGAAIERTRLVLFRPFDIGKWFVLGFCAFLAYLGQGGGGGGGGGFPSGPGGGGGGGGPSAEVQQALDWIKANITLIVGIALVVIVIILVISALVIWVRSRGKFMFIDGLVHNRGAVVEPWKRFRPHGNSLFAFTFVLAFGATLVVLLIIALAVMIAWPDIEAGRFGAGALTAILGGGLLLFLWMLVFGIVSMLLEDFVVPAMYRHDMPVMAAWSAVRADVLSGRLGTIVLYILMKIVLGIAIGIIALVATCATCCIAAIPYIGTVILLPLYVFIRCYSICFLEQLGPHWRFFDDITPAPAVMPGTPA